ncbi:MAG: 3-hydroxyacyl-CoA dehydrogenase family protein [Desulfobacterales bacterium]|nr:3-hydroxyacyl-CoA dehydrogenase family protein [Desulfobacterales bacterium]
MELNKIKHIGVLGAGLMGHGIAQIFASAGYDVNLYDADPAALQAAKGRIADNFKIFIELKLARPEHRDCCLDRISLCPSLEAFVRGPQLIIEAVLEDLKIKRNLYSELEPLTPSDTIFSSNTSAISITELGAAFKVKGRFLGTHFWNPPHVLPCVEVIKGAATADEAFETVYALMEKVGKVPVRVLKDVPGFLGNRLQHAMWREAISLRENNIASAEDIDKVVKYGFGARMPFIGPLETADLAGLGLTRDIHRYLFPYLESSREPSPVLEDLVSAGATGVRGGRGFYEWPPEKVQRIIRQRDGILLRIIHEIVSLTGQRGRKDASEEG